MPINRVIPLLLAALLQIGLATPTWASAPGRSWHYMPTGNGHGFQVFDRQEGKITSFLEHPYRYVAPGNTERTFGVGRRDLAHDIYFGVRVNEHSAWLNQIREVSYEEESHIIHGVSTHGGATIDTYYFSPFTFAGNAMIMLARVTNSTESVQEVRVFSKPNLKLGNGRPEPDDFGEQITWANGVGYETGPGGGHAIYVPVGEVDDAGCGDDASLYQQLLATGTARGGTTCSGSSQVLVMGNSATLEPGEELWWGTALLFLNDNPGHPQSPLFRDGRSPGELLAQWEAFLNHRTPSQLHQDTLNEFESWRAPRLPPQLTETEHALWRQSEAILRMGQILERPGENEGMILAALPPGEWHTGWLRDGAYAIASLAMTGHTEEARKGVEFYLGADAGFYNSPYFNWPRPYRVSVCRYFGNGMEESDFNHEGPNIESDGWGLTLWAARMVLHYSCDLQWLNTPTWRGDTVFEALTEIAENIEAHITNDLPGPDNSIWEVHWDRRQVFSYTAATQLRGLYDFAHIAEAHGREDLSVRFRSAADRMLNAVKANLVYHPLQSIASHQGVSGQEVHVDGSTIEFLHWGLIDVEDPLYTGTLNQYSRLQTGFGGYRRLEPQLSLTGESSANEYDLSEWVLLDLRIGDAWRRLGLVNNDATLLNRAENLLSKITHSAAANDNLVPELFDPNNGIYTGVVPMVGYGAGAWMMSQLEKYSAPAPQVSDSFDHCGQPCVPNPCTDTHRTTCEVVNGAATCLCDPGYHANTLDTCVEDLECTPTTCAGRGVCSPFEDGLRCECETGYAGERCERCDTGYRDEQGDCLPVGGQLTTSPSTPTRWDDGPASLCFSAARSGGEDYLLLLLISFMVLTGHRLRTRRFTGACLSLLALLFFLPFTPQAHAAEAGVNAKFAEDRQSNPDWAFGWTGYVRMPVRFHGSPNEARPPYLVDDDYFLSGFAYTRVNESEWAELFLNATHHNTRLVVGLLSSQLSDWSETTLQGQRGIALAFVDQSFYPTEAGEISLRAGMFWDRDGYSEAYDTYLFGRTHIGGVRLSARWWDTLYGRVGFGSHADVISSNQGFTPIVWGTLGVTYEGVDVALYKGVTWTGDTEREFSIVEEGELDVVGARASLKLPWEAEFNLAGAYYTALNVLFLANSFEVLHSTGGRGLTQNFLGNDSQNGTGEFAASTWNLQWRPAQALRALGLNRVAGYLGGVQWRTFGMSALVQSEQRSNNPAENRDDRLYVKWGTEATYHPHLETLSALFASLRYDRVILDQNHESLSFRVLTPRVGIEPEEGLRLFASYSYYTYGDNVTLRPNQIPGDVSVTTPDSHVFKLQASLAW